MKKRIFSFTLLSCVAKIIAFARELFLAYCYGTSVTSDVFLLSMTLPVTLFGFISSGIAPSFIPEYVSIKESEKGNEEALRFTNKVTNLLLAACIAIILLYYIFSKPFIKIIASGFSEETVDLSISFTNISVLAVPLICVTTVLTAYLQINNRLNITALVSVPLNIGITLAILLAFFLENIYVMPVGFLIASLGQMIYLQLFAHKAGFHYSFALTIRDKQVKIFLQSLVLLSISSSINQINILVDRTLATSIVSGGLSVFEYGSRINDFIMGLSIVPISAAMFPEMARLASDIPELKARVFEGAKVFLILMIPLSFIVAFFSREIVKIIYYRGAFDEQSLKLTSHVVFFYGVGLTAFGLRELMSKAFYAVSDSKTPAVNAAIGVLMNIILNFILSRVMGIGGLALATSISAFVCIVLMMISLDRKLGNFNWGSLFSIMFKITIISFLSGIISKFFYNKVFCLISSELVRMGISLIVFLIFFVVLSIRMHIMSIKQLFEILKLQKRN